MAVAVHEANLHDSKGAPKVIERLEHKFPRLVKILADGGYMGTLGDWIAKKFGCPEQTSRRLRSKQERRRLISHINFSLIKRLSKREALFFIKKSKCLYKK